MMEKVEMNSEKEAQQGHTHVQWLLAILVNSIVMVYGLQAGWISPMANILQSASSPAGHPLSDDELSWIAASLTLAAIFTTSAFSYVTDRYGRKVALIAITVMQAITWIVKLTAASTTGLIIARLVCGLAAGGCFNAVPMYTKEIAQNDIRGKLGTLLFMFQNIGFLTMYAVGYYLDYYTVLWVMLGIPIVIMVFLMKIPESPAYLMKIGKIEEVTSTLAFLRGLSMDDKKLLAEVEDLKNEAAHFQSMPNLTLVTIFKDKAYRRIFLIMLAVISCHALNGSFAILTYAASIMTASGSTFSPELQTLSFPVVMLIGSFTSLFCVERLGRRLLLILAFIVSTLALGVFGTSILIRTLGGSTIPWIPVVTIMMTVFSYAAGVGPVPYVVMTEMLNDEIRAKLMGLIVTYTWSLGFLHLLNFSSISSALGLHTTFFIFAGVNLAGVFVVFFFMPETKGKSVEEIERRNLS